MAAPASPIVGRSAELEALDRALARLRQGRPGGLAVVGEPGIGKTRLLSEVASRTSQREIVLRGSASEYEHGLPFGPFVAALDAYVRSLDGAVLRALDDEARSELGHILPSWPTPTPGATAGRDAQDGRYRAHRAVRLLLEQLASSQPLVLVLDDLHWADAETLELVGTLLRRPPAVAVLLVLATRPRQTPALLSAAIETARRSGLLERLDLGALAIDEARALLGEARAGEVLSAEDVVHLHAASQGNPYYLEQLARLPRPFDLQVPDAARDPDDELPRVVAAVLTEELGMLPPEVRRLLEGAAVAGDPFELDLAATAAGVADAPAIDGLDELLRRDLVRHTDTPRRFRFRHPLVRRAVYEAAPGGWRLAAHERCAQALFDRRAPALVLADHVQHAGRHGDQRAVDTLVEAGEAAAARAPDHAARLFTAALRLAPAGGPDQLRLVSALAGAQETAGHFGDAHASYLRALSLVDPDDVDTHIRLTAPCAALEQLLGRHREAHERLTLALDRLPDEPAPRSVLLMFQLGIDGFFRLDYDAMHDWAQRAMAAAELVGERALRVSAASLHAIAAALNGGIGVADASRDRAAALADTMSDDELLACPDRFVNLAAAELYLDRHREARAHIERSLAIARSSGRERVVPVLYWAGTIRAAQGDLAGAVEVLDTAVDVARLAGHDRGLVWNLAGRALVAAAAGDTATGLEAGREAASIVSGQANVPAVVASLACATALCEGGRPDEAVDQLQSCAGGRGPDACPPGWRPQAYELLTRAELARGRLDDARRWAERAGRAADRLGLPSAVGYAERAAGAVTLAAAGAPAGGPAGGGAAARTGGRRDGDAALAPADGGAEAALGRLSRAVGAFERAGRVVDAAATRTLAARAAQAAGDIPQAVALLTEAAGQFDAWGAVPRRDEAERELRRLGQRRHRRSAPASPDGSALASLTGREREIADLIAAGRTNRQIAAELYLSTKTVETHIRNVFHKLGAATRIDVARSVTRAEREP